MPYRLRAVEPDEDVVRQGDRPDVAVFVLNGMLARYHTLPSGNRQYLSFHIPSDMPDVQSLFLDVMDHSVCAIDRGMLALFAHAPLRNLLKDRPLLTFAFWRLTLVDAAMFRQAITNMSRTPVARLSHLFCEIFFRAKQNGFADGNSCRFPVTQHQIGQALGMSHISVNRALQRLRRAELVDFRNGVVSIYDWQGLGRVAEFDPLYLHIA